MTTTPEARPERDCVVAMMSVDIECALHEIGHKITEDQSMAAAAAAYDALESIDRDTIATLTARVAELEGERDRLGTALFSNNAEWERIHHSKSTDFGLVPQIIMNNRQALAGKARADRHKSLQLHAGASDDRSHGRGVAQC